MMNIYTYCESQKIKWVFFDFFDTIVHRKCLPDDIKHYWANEMSFYFNASIKREIIYKIRRSSEIFLMNKNICNDGEFNYIELCKDMYQRTYSYCKINNINFKILENEYIEKCITLELEIEKKNQYKNNNVVGLLKKLASKGINIAIISDFYLGEKEIRFFLDNLGIENYISKIYISSDIKKNKYYGKIYSYVLEDLNLNPCECIMIGDTKRSDFINAKNNNITAFLIKNKYTGPSREKEKVIKELINIYNKEKYHELRYGNYSFMCALFIERLYFSLINEGFSDVYFLAREGEGIKRLFDKYQENMNKHIIKTHYVYVSRKSTFSATLRDINEEKFDKLKKIGKLSIKSFFINLGFNEKYIEEIQKDIKLDIDIEIDQFFLSDEFNKIKNNKVFMRIYEINRIEAKEKIKQYFSQEKMNNEDKIAIVDVGWAGTMQDHIYNIYDGKKEIYGYYFGFTNQEGYMVGNEKKGLIFTKYPIESKDYKLWSYDYTFLERIFTASHATTDNYKLENNKVIPILLEYECEKESYVLIKPIQNIIEKKLIEIFDIVYSNGYIIEDFYELILKLHLNTIYDININQIRLQKKMYNSQIQNFGNIKTAKQQFSEVFSIKNIIKKFIYKIKLIKNTELLFRICVNYNMEYLIYFIYKFKNVQNNLKRR